jgi:hypothetical protein
VQLFYAVRTINVVHRPARVRPRAEPCQGHADPGVPVHVGCGLRRPTARSARAGAQEGARKVAHAAHIPHGRRCEQVKLTAL